MYNNHILLHVMPRCLLQIIFNYMWTTGKWFPIILLT